MIISVVNFKGGVGKTTTALHLCEYMARQDKTVLLVDSDLNRSSLAVSKQGKLKFRVIDEKSAMKYAKEFDYMVVDTAGGRHMEDLQALAEGCDLLIVPVAPDPLALAGTLQLVITLQSLKVNHYMLVLTMCPPATMPDTKEAHQTLNELNLPLSSAQIPKTIAVARAVYQGVTLADLKTEQAQRAWAQYEILGKEAWNYGKK
ncbi:MAG: ParA family protein [Acidobacteriota bacterium]